MAKGSKRVRRGGRRIFLWGPILWLCVTVNLGAAAYASLATRVTTLRVVGAMSHDQMRISRIVQQLRDTPVLRINAKQVESDILSAADVRDAKLSLSPFGSAVLTVTYRRPVAEMEEIPGVLMDDVGVLYPVPASDTPTGLPNLKLQRGEPPTLLTLVGDWPAARIAHLAEEVRKKWPQRIVGIEVDDRGAVCLNMNPGRVILGSTDELESKLAALGHRMETDPDELARVVELNLTQPDRPSFVVRPPSRQRQPK